MNFQMFKLVLEKAEEPEIKLPISTGSSKKRESSRKTSIDYVKAFDCVEHNKLEDSERDGNTRWEYLLKNLYAGQETTVRTGHGTTDWFQIQKGNQIIGLTTLKLLTAWITTNCGKFLKRWEYQTT